MADFDDKLHRRILDELGRETPVHPSPTLAGIVTSRPPDWLFHHGVALLDSPMPDERVIGSRLLRELPAPWAQDAGSELLKRLTHERDADVAAWFIRAVGFLRLPRALPTVLSFRGHADAAVREAVATALSECSDRDLSAEARDVLVALANDSDREVRFSAVFALGSWWQGGLRDTAVEAALRQATRDTAVFVRNAANDVLPD